MRNRSSLSFAGVLPFRRRDQASLVPDYNAVVEVMSRPVDLGAWIEPEPFRGS